jgi:hypothetical protein
MHFVTIPVSLQHAQSLWDRLAAMDASTLAAWVTALVTLLGALTALLAVWWQLRKQWLLNSAAMVTDLADRFVSDEWRIYRMHCAARFDALQRGEEVDLSEDLPVLGLFEHMGFLVRRGILDRLMVWNKFGWYITRYYLAVTTPVNLIDQIRKRERDETLWDEFQWLNKDMLRIYRRRSIIIDGPALAATRIKELLKQEANLKNLVNPAIAPKLILPTDQGRLETRT